MNGKSLFLQLSGQGLSEAIRSAGQSVCYAAPGVQLEVAMALVSAADRLGVEMLTVSLDFDEQVMRVGYGELQAVQRLIDAGISIQNSPGLRTALLIVDNEGYVFTPTALYLEAEPVEGSTFNAMRMSQEQVSQALARLSPSAKAIAIAQAKSPEDKKKIEALSVDVDSKPLSKSKLNEVTHSLKAVPPVSFDLARQVRVFEPYLQYVELRLTGAAIQRYRLAIPKSIQKLGGSKDLEDRLRTTFELIEKNSNLSSKPLEDALNEIRKNLTRSLGKDHGRLVLKATKPLLKARLAEFREKLEVHQKTVEVNLQKHLDTSRSQVIDYYLPRLIASMPDALLGQSLDGEVSDASAKAWLNAELDRVFPQANYLVQEMRLEENYKDVTFETLNHKGFLSSVKKEFPGIDWDKTYREFRAAAQSTPKQQGQDA